VSNLINKKLELSVAVAPLKEPILKGIFLMIIILKVIGYCLLIKSVVDLLCWHFSSGYQGLIDPALFLILSCFAFWESHKRHQHQILLENEACIHYQNLLEAYLETHPGAEITRAEDSNFYHQMLDSGLQIKYIDFAINELSPSQEAQEIRYQRALEEERRLEEKARREEESRLRHEEEKRQAAKKANDKPYKCCCCGRATTYRGYCPQCYSNKNNKPLWDDD